MLLFSKSMILLYMFTCKNQFFFNTTGIYTNKRKQIFAKQKCSEIKKIQPKINMMCTQCFKFIKIAKKVLYQDNINKV